MQINKQSSFTIILLTLLLNSILWSQVSFDPVTDVPMSVVIEPAQVPVNGSGKLIITLEMPAKTHITSRAYGFFFVNPNPTEGIKFGNAVYPAGVELDDEIVFQGNVKVSIPFTLIGDFTSGERIEFAGIVGYQGCTEVDPIMCTQPVERTFSTLLVIGSENNTNLNDDIVNRSQLETVEQENLTADDDADLSIEQRVKRALETGSGMALIWIFIGGVLLSLTPCVYPVIPITIAFVGAKAGGSKLKGFSLSLVFVLGLAMVYSLLGVIAAATGGVFGLSGQNPWVIGFVTLVFLVMGAGMLGAFEITIPSSIQTKL
ncbi:MAG: hypothetical protein HQ568_08900, partial [Calditrichaeota bacterium]|nr:hypothetical protein [Calditrichota bacterium]